MIKGSFVVLCVWEFLMVTITFHADDVANSRKFFQKQLAPHYEKLATCSISWVFEYNFTPEPGISHLTANALYGCVNFNSIPEYNQGQFYICMMTRNEDIGQAAACAESSSIDWINYLMYCNPNDLINHTPTKPQVKVQLDNVESPEAIENFKKVVCKKLKEMNLSCDAC